MIPKIIKQNNQEEKLRINHEYIPALDNIAYWGYFTSNGQWYPRSFDKFIIELLYYAEQGKVSKILLSIPSRHGKSTLISKLFTSYYLCKYPNDKVILSSYSQALASEFGGQVKDLINYYGHYTKYAPTIATDSKAKNRFHIAPPYNGQMLAVGAAGSILGFGANLFIIDDPIKNVAEARSQVIQEKLRNWFTGTAKTRLETRINGKPPIMIVIAQRLDTRDLHGIIKETEPYIESKEAFTMLRNGETIPNDVWVNFNLQAICTHPETDILGRKEGEVLWKEQRDYNWLMSEKHAMGSFLFNCIYQGEPSERDGELFKREWFYDEYGRCKCLFEKDYSIESLPKMRYWDCAASGLEGDETSGILTAYDGTYLYVLGLNNGKYTALETKRQLIRTALRDGKNTRIVIEQEPGSASKILISDLQHDPQLRGFNIKSDKVKQAKNIRSFELENLAEDGRLKFLNSSWSEKIINQLISFTGVEGGCDDIVDSLTGSARMWLHRKTKIII